MGCTLSSTRKVFGGEISLARIERFPKGSDGRDKFAKAVAATAVLAAAISEHVNGKTHPTTTEAQRVASFANTARDVNGLLNIFGGVLSTIRNISFTVLPSLFINLNNNTTVYLRGGPKQGQNPTPQQRLDSATLSFEKKLAVIESVAALITAIAYTIGFGVCRVISFAGRVRGQLGVGAQNMVKAFAPLMFISHVTALVSNGAALWRRHKIAVQALASADSNSTFGLHYTQQTVVSALSMGEAALEVVCDAVKFGAPVPPIPRAVLAVIIAIFGIAKVWGLTYEVPKSA